MNLLPRRVCAIASEQVFQHAIGDNLAQVLAIPPRWTHADGQSLSRSPPCLASSPRDFVA